MFPFLYKHSKRKNRIVANTLENDNWVTDIIHNVSAPLLPKFILLWIGVDVAHFDPSDRQLDEISWTRSANRRYYASSAYKMQFDGSLTSSFQAKIWQARAPSRCMFFA
jgi:hypothetical protein